MYSLSHGCDWKRTGALRPLLGDRAALSEVQPSQMKGIRIVVGLERRKSFGHTPHGNASLARHVGAGLVLLVDNCCQQQRRIRRNSQTKFSSRGFRHAASGLFKVFPLQSEGTCGFDGADTLRVVSSSK